MLQLSMIYGYNIKASCALLFEFLLPLSQRQYTEKTNDKHVISVKCDMKHDT